jgi:hypothetical protein
MKRIIGMLCLTLAFVLTATAQESQPKHRAFLGLGANYMPGYNLSYSAEVGAWGMSAPTSFSAVFDMVPVDGDITYYAGAKLYFTTYSTDKICYMVYLAPKVNLNDIKQGIFEFGFNPNYTLHKNWLFGVTIGNQVYEGSNWNLFSSAGFIYLFPKK